MNEKKKVIVLVVLFVVVIAIGAFQFIGGAAPAATTTAVKDEPTGESEGAADGAGAAEGEGSETTLVEGEEGVEGEGTVDEQLLFDASGREVVALAARDPFSVPAGTKPVTTVQTPPTDTAPPRISKPVRRDPLPGSFPLDPGSFGPLPGANYAPTEEPEPAFRVTGVLVGVKPIAVFEDDKGNQRLVPLGGSVDGDTKVTGIERGKVTITRHGKDKTLVIQEEARNDN